MQSSASNESAQQAPVEVPQDPVKLHLYMRDLQRDIYAIRSECYEVGKTFAENQSKINRRRKMQFRTSVTGLELACLSYTSRVHQSRAKALEKKLAVLGDKISEIEKQSRERENLYLPSSNFLSSFYALPTEIIRYIFVLCNAPPHPPRFGGRSQYFVPPTHIILSRVCTTFRQIVIGSPELWTSVKLDMSDRAAIRMLPTHLSRSGLRTLHLSIYAPKGTSLEQFWLAWNPVALTMFRIATLDLLFEENALLDKVLRYLRYHRAPRLTTLRIFCSPKVVTSPVSDLFKLPCACFIQHAPSLASLDFRHVLPGMATWNSEIRRLHLEMPRDLPITWLPIFASFSGVVALDIEGWHYASISPPFQRTITFPRLRYLKFGPRRSMRDIHIFLTMVNMTNLESLCIVWHSPMDIIQLFCTLSGLGPKCPIFPLLRRLSFMCPSHHPPSIARQSDWVAVGPFNNLPFTHVEKLALVGFPKNDALLDVLFSPHMFKYPSILPRLKTLSVCSYADHPHVSTLERIVSTRRLVGYPLSRIEFTQTRSVVNPMWGLKPSFSDHSVQWVTIDSETFAKQINSECFPPLDKL